MPSDVRAQLLSVAVRNATFITDVWTNTKVNLAHVFLKSTVNNTQIQ